jgi:DNA-binding transcriptional LysR family regulator
MKTPRITLEQWAAFKAVVDEGSFAQAAEALNKSQSSISYAIARLNEQLPRPVLQLEGRKASLSADGKVLYRRATQLLQQADDAEQTARMLARGLETEIRLAVDALLEISALIPVLDEFSRQFPLTRLKILETSLSGTEEALLEKRADLVIGSKVPVGFMGTPLKQVRIIAVARPDHPLFTAEHDLGDAGIADWELRSHRQVVLRDTGYRREQDAGWLGSEQRWTVSHFSSSVKILKSGLAFALLPSDWVKTELEQGELKQLPVRGAERILQLYLMSGAIEADGPATSALAELLIRHFKKQTASPA